MTEDRKAKRAVRSRMEATGEKYTQARRALLDGDPEKEPAGAWQAPSPMIGRFTDQAHNAILLAEDEARMLGQARVEPEHLLLALARYGNVQDLLGRVGITASAIYAAVVRMGGFSSDLTLGPIPRSSASDAVLKQATFAAAKRGLRDPSTQHVLLGLAEEGSATALLRELGLADIVQLCDARYPIDRASLDPEMAWRRALVAGPLRAPSPGPMPPVFERFTAQARRAIEAAVESADSLENGYVEPAHLLLGLLSAQQGVVASVRTRHEPQFDAAIGYGVARLRERPGDPTEIFTAEARRLVAEQVLIVAHRLGHSQLGTGHLFLAVLEAPDEDILTILEQLTDAQQIAAEVMKELPGDEGT